MACLLTGTLLWLGWGAVRGLAYWRVTAGSYVVALAIAGLAFGLVWPGPHWRTALLLVVPGLVALLAPESGGHPDLIWWLLAVLTGVAAAAGSHWVGAELRRNVAARRR